MEVQDSSSVTNSKQYTNVATVKVRTLRLESKRNKLVNNCKTHTIPILGNVDREIVHNDKILYQHLENNISITPSAWRNTNNVSSGDVGLTINRRAKNALAKVESWKKRTFVANFNGNFALAIIVEGSNKGEKHYNLLAVTVKDVPKHNILVVM